MSLKTPVETIDAIIAVGEAKSKVSTGYLAAQSILAGMLVGMAGLACVCISGGMPGIKQENPAISKFFFGGCFGFGLLLIVGTKAELFTGNTMFMMSAWIQGKCSWQKLLRSWVVSFSLNFVGALIMAYLFSGYTGLLDNEPLKSHAQSFAYVKVGPSSWGQVFVKGIGANWMVCMALWLAFQSESVTGKMVGIWFPVQYFVSIGFEHSIANMYLVPTAIYCGADITFWDFIWKNLIPTTLGNIVGGAFIVGAWMTLTFATPAVKAGYKPINEGMNGINGETSL